MRLSHDDLDDNPEIPPDVQYRIAGVNTPDDVEIIEFTNATYDSTTKKLTIGTPAPTTPTTAIPAVPTGSTATASSSISGAIDLTWTAAARATSYSYQYRIGTTGDWTEVLTGTSTTARLLGVAGQSYQFQVRATNNTGNSAWSSTITRTAPTIGATGSPSAPTISRVSVNRFFRQIKIRRTVPLGTLPDGTYFQYRWRIGTGAWTQRNESSDLFDVTLPINSIGMTYEIQGRVGNSNGLSPWSTSITGILLASSGTSDPSKNFTNAILTDVRGANSATNPLVNAYGPIWTDGTTMFSVASTSSSTQEPVWIIAYNLSTKARDPDKDINIGNLIDPGDNQFLDHIFDITGNSTTIYATGVTPNEWIIYAFDRATKTRDTSKEFSQAQLLAGGIFSTTSFVGIHLQDTTMYVKTYYNVYNSFIRAYNTTTKARESNKDIRVYYPPNFSIGIGPLWGHGTLLYDAIPTSRRPNPDLPGGTIPTLGAYAWGRDTGARMSSEDIIVDKPILQSSQIRTFEGIAGTENTVWFSHRLSTLTLHALDAFFR